MRHYSLRTLLAASTLLAALPAHAETVRWSVVTSGEKVGFVEADEQGSTVAISYDVKNNGRGPTTTEEIELGADGLPVRWAIDGTSTFGSEVRERFARDGQTVRWTDSTGTQEREQAATALYIAQNGSPWALGLYARALLKDEDQRMAALPGGELQLEALGEAQVQGTTYRAFSISGIDLSPELILLDPQGRLFARIDTDGATVREGSEGAVPELTELATRLTAERFAALQKRFAHTLDGPMRIRNVRVFDPKAGTLGDPVSVVVSGERIAGIHPLDAPATPGEIVVDGQGGTILPGLHDMHAHVSPQSALLYLAAGVTSIRDMGNDNAVLDGLMERIEDGTVAGPRIVRNGFLEGRSSYSARNGIIAASEAEAVEAVRWYAARGYWQIKIYNSMNPDWIPAVVREAHRLGMGVTGHIPAFTNADTMIAAGYDEVTHINQLMLGWVLDPQEDTRTPLRLTAMRRTADLDLSSAQVQQTIEAMAAHDIALDPTAVTLELLMLSRDGQPSPAVANYIDHLPIALQRRRRQGIAPIETLADAAAYEGSFVKIKELIKRLHDRGVRLLPGTDDATGLSLHRELQIYGEAGIAPAEVLRLGTLAPEVYMGRDQNLGSVERGKYADFLLLPGNPLEDLRELHRIAMVVKDGTIYFPSEIHAAFGVKPFAEAPAIPGLE
ncbi:amidohydrolase family protein [Altererythrobacter sp. C41]|uniref:amidohydrolase family protein n=1 Tax=Altererythrobacter sp. C41 TaxID=2806021 RepID=UPI0019314D4D|nr:amidohydrolase family protein [Altererythrobacter sp. C41]MBM0170172.1 amidohydrolase family protein [Altererythrobacter sp. C41]